MRSGHFVLVQFLHRIQYLPRNRAGFAGVIHESLRLNHRLRLRAAGFSACVADHRRRIPPAERTFLHSYHGCGRGSLSVGCARVQANAALEGAESGGPGRDRTDDLFHAMEARSQLRHRPTLRKRRELQLNSR